MSSAKSLRRILSPTFIVLCVAIFFVALLPRLNAVDRYITPDELRWVDRSIRFSNALAQGDFASTILSGHPGVITMWLGSLGIRALSAQHTLPAALPAFDPQNAEVVRLLAQYLDAARFPVIFLVALNLVLLFVLLDQLIDRRAAFLVAGLIALDPFAVALGGILHVDALMMTFSLNSLAALGIALYRQRRARWLILSGVLAGLAMLSKSPAVVLSVAAFIVIGVDTLRRRRSIWQAVRELLIWGLSAAAIFFLLYPAMWVAPLKTILRMRTTAENFSETAHAVNFFNGSNARDPGPLFYPIVLAYRSTPLLWLGLIASVILVVRAKSEHDRHLRSLAWVYGVFAIIFLGVITLGAKKLDRYVLPSLESLYVISGLGLAFVVESVGKRVMANAVDKKPQWLLNGMVAAFLVISALQFVPAWPLALRAYNPLLGGYDRAKNVLPVGGGESAEVGQVLHASSYAGDSIAVSDIVGTAPYFSGELRPLTAAGLTQADWLLVTASDMQLTPDDTQKWIGAAAPVMTFTVQGQPYAWLYPNPSLAVEHEHFNAQVQPADALLTDYASGLAQDRSAQVLADLDDAAAAELLAQVARQHDRVWVIHYATTPRRVLDPVLRLLDTHAVALDEWSTPVSEGALYALPAGVSFTAQPTALNGDVQFGDNVQLHAAQLIVPHVQPGQSIGLFTEWTATGPATQLEVSVMDEANHTWTTGAVDVPLQEVEPRPRGRRISVPVPLTMPPGEYRLVLNVIDMASGSPLSTRQKDGSLGGIDWPLGSITIEPAQSSIDPATRKPPITLNADLGGLVAIGTETPPEPIVGGDPWTLAMEWASTSDQLPALDVQWEWAQHGQVVYSTTLPLNRYSTERWRKGDVLQSKYDFRVPTSLPDGVYDLRFKVIERSSGKPLNDQATQLTMVKVGSRPRAFSMPAAASPLAVTFDDVARLVGTDVNRAGTQLTLTLFWQGQVLTTTNYTTFVQLLNPDGSIAQQSDRWQIAFNSPTSTWLPGQVIADQYVFEVSSDALRIGAGLYDAATGKRLPAIEAGQRLPQDRVILK